MAATDAARSDKSFLSPVSFPKTFNDLSFTDKMAVLADGYADFDPEYDENGICVSGCAYKGIKLEDELRAIERNTQAANARLDEYLRQHPAAMLSTLPADTGTAPAADTGGHGAEPATVPTRTNPAGGNTAPARNTPTVQPTTPSASPADTGTAPAADTGGHRTEPATVPARTNPAGGNTTPARNTPPAQSTTPSANDDSTARTCAKYTDTIKPIDVVIQAPLAGALVITSDFGTRARPCANCSANHRGIDLRAARGTNIYAPANGTVVSVWTDAKCGNGIKIKHPDGIYTVYCHLSRQLVASGDAVQGGCLIGLTGNTGASTGPHLHYALKTDAGFIDPLWDKNRLGREYKFQKGQQPSREHAGKKLPGRTE